MSSSVRLQLNHIHAKLILSNSSYHYHPQIKFVKVMFSQVFVCARGVPVQGSLYRGGGLCRGSQSRVVSVQGGLSPGWSLSRGSLSRGSLSRGSLSRGFSGVEIPTPVMVTCGQHASYWNAFFFLYCS